MSAETVSLGCRLNFAEAETIARDAPKGEDWIVVNSCAVTNEAVRQTRQAIRRAHRRRPDARILVTGCAAELDRQAFERMPEVARVVGNANKLNAFAATDVKAAASGSHSLVRSFVAVQNGCDHRCTFCSIWQARGPSVSLPFEVIRDAIARELDRGAKEIVLTGVDITDYEGGLGSLCQRLLAAEPRLKRLRLSSLDSVEMDDALFEVIADERLMPHFHLSLQAGDDMILKRMKRRHSRAQAIAMVERLKAARSDSTIGADLIAGFPTETEGMALNTLQLLEDCDVVAAHIFPFSPRPDTPAARMPQVERETVKARSARLREAAETRRRKWLDSLVGTVQPVLVETRSRGHSNGFAPVFVAGAQRGDLGTARIAARDGDQLVGVFE